MELSGQCDCCDYFTLPSKGDWEICPVCYWEDDVFGLEEPDAPSGANHGLTLREAKANFELLGACCESMRIHVLPAEARARFRRVPRKG